MHSVVSSFSHISRKAEEGKVLLILRQEAVAEEYRRVPCLRSRGRAGPQRRVVRGQRTPGRTGRPPTKGTLLFAEEERAATATGCHEREREEVLSLVPH